MEFFEVVHHKGTVRIERKEDHKVMAIFKGDIDFSGVVEWHKYFETYLTPKNLKASRAYDAQKHFTTTQDLEKDIFFKSEGPPAEV